MAIHALGYRKIIDFCHATGIKKSTLYAVLNNQTRDPGAWLLEKLYRAGVNLNWLISGEGEILHERAPGRQAPAAAGPRPYPEGSASPIEKKIRDAMDDIMGLYQQLKELHFYAAELEKLSPERQAMFHKMLRALLKSLQEREEGGEA